MRELGRDVAAAEDRRAARAASSMRMTCRRCGTARRCVDDPSGTTARDPVASTMWSAVIVSPVDSCSVVGSVNSACASYSVTFGVPSRGSRGRRPRSGRCGRRSGRGSPASRPAAPARAGRAAPTRAALRPGRPGRRTSWSGCSRRSGRCRRTTPSSTIAIRQSSKSGVTSELPEPEPMITRSKCATLDDDTARASPARHRLGHQVAEEVVELGASQAAAGEPAADVGAVALQEVRRPAGWRPGRRSAARR